MRNLYENDELEDVEIDVEDVIFDYYDSRGEID